MNNPVHQGRVVHWGETDAPASGLVTRSGTLACRNHRHGVRFLRSAWHWPRYTELFNQLLASKMEPGAMEDAQKDRLRTYAWNYFAYHAEQRMKTFHFYLITIAALIVGFVSAAVTIPTEYFHWLSIVGLLITIFSVAFAFMDKRNANLVRNGEAALRWLDEQEGLPNEDGLPNLMAIFSRDDTINEAKPKVSLINAHVSYSKILRVIFWTIGLIGLACAFVSVTTNAG